MHKIYYRVAGDGADVYSRPPGEIPVYIESVEVRGQQLGLFDHTNTEVIITYRPLDGADVPATDGGQADTEDQSRVSWLAAPRKGVQSRMGSRGLRDHHGRATSTEALP